METALIKKTDHQNISLILNSTHTGKSPQGKF